MGGIKRMKSREVENILARYGFELVSQQGSHRKWRHADKRLQVIVPEHAGQDLPLGTLRNIFVNAQVPESEWKV
ncbi:MAG TPA: type II toxin-antitoxin system HicA family toxin [Armatimonadota bacterium]|nr:type II toxin-antitoxin system HicA family toxin [Armatimonadota bacterium]HOM70997.1 type II toxin-antitoxin system HicA family toxin [Armatimonadota bacterium]